MQADRRSCDQAYAVAFALELEALTLELYEPFVREHRHRRKIQVPVPVAVTQQLDHRRKRLVTGVAVIDQGSS